MKRKSQVTKEVITKEVITKGVGHEWHCGLLHKEWRLRRDSEFGVVFSSRLCHQCQYFRATLVERVKRGSGPIVFGM